MIVAFVVALFVVDVVLIAATAVVVVGPVPSVSLLLVHVDRNV